MQSIAIIDRGRGPELAGTRITVFDLIDYFESGWHDATIAANLRLSSDQVAAMRQHFDAHREPLMEEHRRNLEMVARGNTPEAQQKLARAHEKLQLLLAEKRKPRDQAQNPAVTNGRPHRG
jgi:hypothetical protein